MSELVLTDKDGDVLDWRTLNPNYKPASDAYLVLEIKENFGGSKIALPDGSTLSLPKGRIIRASEGRYPETGDVTTRIPMQGKRGDICYWKEGADAGPTVIFDSVKYRLYRDWELVGWASKDMENDKQPLAE